MLHSSTNLSLWGPGSSPSGGQKSVPNLVGIEPTTFVFGKSSKDEPKALSVQAGHFRTVPLPLRYADLKRTDLTKIIQIFLGLRNFLNQFRFHRTDTLQNNTRLIRVWF